MLEAEWGEAVPPKPWPRRSTRDPKIRAVFVQLSESSTGAAHDVEAHRARHARQRDTLLVVDAISGAGAMRARDRGLGRRRGGGGQPEGAGPAARPGLPLAERAGLGARRDARRRRASTSTCGASARRRPTASRPSRPPSRIVVALEGRARRRARSMGGVDALVRQRGRRWPAMTRAAAQALGAAAGGAARPRRRAHRALPAAGHRVRRHRQGAEGRVRVHRGRRPGRAQGQDPPHRPPRLLRRDRHPGPAGARSRSCCAASATASSWAPGWPPPRPAYLRADGSEATVSYQHPRPRRHHRARAADPPGRGLDRSTSAQGHAARRAGRDRRRPTTR